MTTLLDIVQDMLSSINGDQVSSYASTVESRRCAKIAEQVFLEFIANTTVEEQEDLIQLDGVGDVLNPTQLLVPDKIDKIVKLEYKDSTGRFRDVHYLEPVEFVEKLNNNVGLTNTVEMTYNSAGLVVRTDQQPHYWTTFNDRDIIMDAFEQNIEATLQGSKTRVIVSYAGPETWTTSDTFVIPLDADAISTYKAECMERAWFVIKERSNAGVTKAARRERAKLHHRTSVYDNTHLNYASYGRQCGQRRNRRPVLNRD